MPVMLIIRAARRFIGLITGKGSKSQPDGPVSQAVAVVGQRAVEGGNIVTGACTQAPQTVSTKTVPASQQPGQQHA